MKYNILGLVAGVTLLASSCTDETPIESPSVNGDGTVTLSFTVSQEGVVTSRASDGIPAPDYAGVNGFMQIGDGTKAHKLIWAVYDEDGNIIPEMGSATETDDCGYGQNVVYVEQFPYTMQLSFEIGKDYQIAFWAQNEDCQSFNTKDLRAVTVDYKSDGSNVCNDELRDAFCKVETFKASEIGVKSHLVILRRPFAQINLGIPKEEYEAMYRAGVRIKESMIHIENVSTEFDVVSNMAQTEGNKRQAIDYSFSRIPAYVNYESNIYPTPEEVEIDRENNPGKEQFLRIDVNKDGKIENYGDQNSDGKDETYKYLMMCYVLPAAARTEDSENTDMTTLDRVEITMRPEADGQNDMTFNLYNIPLQANYRTNIYGRLFTSDVTLEVEMDEMGGGVFNYPDIRRIYEGVDYDYVNKRILISNGKGLQWVADATNGVWPTKESYTEGDADLFMEAAKVTSWPVNGYYHFDDVHILLVNDIDFANHGSVDGVGEYFTPIGFSGTETQNDNMTNGKFFNGYFDGGNHTINNLKTVRPDSWTSDKSFGLFATIGRHAKIKNVRLKNVDIEGHYCVGGIVGRVYSYVYYWQSDNYDGEAVSISNCYVDGGTITSTSRYTGWEYDDANNVGGIVGIFYNSGRIEDCFVRNVTIRAYRANSGILGQVGGDYLGDGVTLKNCKVYDVTLIADQFQEYGGYKGMEINNFFVAKNTVNAIRYEFEDGSYKGDGDFNRYDTDFGTNSQGNNQIFAFRYDNTDVPGYGTVKYTEIGSEFLKNPPVDIFPRLIGKYSQLVRFNMSVLGGPSAWKKYDDDNRNYENEWKGYPLENSGRVGLWVSGLTIDGDTDGNDETIDNYTVTVSNVDSPGDCVMYIYGEGTVKNLTVHGAGYAYQGICLAPQAGKTITLDDVFSYDARTVLTDDGEVEGGVLEVKGSNFRGNVKYSSGYENVSFEGTTFEESTKRSEESDVINSLTVGNDTKFTDCVFMAPYQIIIPEGVNVEFDNCVAMVRGKTTQVAIDKSTGTITISTDESGEPTVE